MNRGDFGSAWAISDAVLQERIRRARRNGGMSQAALAERLHVRRSAVSNWESANDVHPSMQNLIAIARVCEVSLEWLGTGRGAMAQDPASLADVPAAHAELVDAHDERELLAGFPTSATAVFAYDGAWAALSEGAARLVGYHVGRG